jgi:hypothetical protein
MFIGLISMFLDSTLQDDIEAFCRDLLARGCEILRSSSAPAGEGKVPSAPIPPSI